MFEKKHEKQSTAYLRYLHNIPKQLEHFKVAIMHIKDWVSYAKMPKIAIGHLFSPRKPISTCFKLLKVGRQIHQDAFTMYIKKVENQGTLKYLHISQPCSLSRTMKFLYIQYIQYIVDRLKFIKKICNIWSPIIFPNRGKKL